MTATNNKILLTFRQPSFAGTIGTKKNIGESFNGFGRACLVKMNESELLFEAFLRVEEFLLFAANLVVLFISGSSVITLDVAGFQRFWLDGH